jgi:hypothetical protein
MIGCCYGLDHQAAVVQVHVVVCRTACGEEPLSYPVGLPNEYSIDLADYSYRTVTLRRLGEPLQVHTSSQKQV